MKLKRDPFAGIPITEDEIAAYYIEKYKEEERRYFEELEWSRALSREKLLKEVRKNELGK